MASWQRVIAQIEGWRGGAWVTNADQDDPQPGDLSLSLRLVKWLRERGTPAPHEFGIGNDGAVVMRYLDADAIWLFEVVDDCVYLSSHKRG